MSRLLVLLCTVLTCAVMVKGQSPNVPALRDLAQESAVVAAGNIEEVTWVVRPDKMVPTMRGNVAQLPDPSDFVVGRVARMRIDEVLKNNGKLAKGTVINVFMPGRVPNEGEPVVLEKRNYVLLLSRLEPDRKKFAGTVISQAGTSPNDRKPFNPKSHYVVVGNGSIEITPKNHEVIKEIKLAIRK
jgi:hypothetical protein